MTATNGEFALQSVARTGVQHETHLALFLDRTLSVLSLRVQLQVVGAFGLVLACFLLVLLWMSQG